MEFKEFLIKAKKNTYASDDSQEAFVEGARELTFEEGDFVYKDKYFGIDPFSGEEIVWQADIPVWSMNYYGKIISSSVLSKDVYPFLRKAMGKVDEESIFRGPSKFVEGDFTYENKSTGDIDLFKGEESIFFKGEKVYLLVYHGGRVNGKD